MTREEVIAAGMEVHETQHSMKRRTPWHDYSRKGTYMLTLVVKERAALFGTLRGNLAGGVAPYVELSNLGTAILQEEIHKIYYFYPQVEVWKPKDAPKEEKDTAVVLADLVLKKVTPEIGQ